MQRRVLTLGCVALLCWVSAQAQVRTYPYPDYTNTDWQKPGATTPLAPALIPFVEATSPRLFPDTTHEGADEIIRFNACGREADYSTIRGEMASGDFDHSGSELASILVAKILWLNNRATGMNPPPGAPAPEPCSYTLGVPLNASQLTALKGEVASVPNACAAVTAAAATYNTFATATFTVSNTCLQQQVNDAIMAMQKVGNLGSSKLLCEGASTTSGEWDQNNRWLVRLLYLGTQTLQGSTQFAHTAVLNPPTVSYMETSGLLAAQGDVGPDDYPVDMGSCSGYAGDQSGDPQTAEDNAEYAQSLGGELDKDLKWLLAFLARLTAANGIGLATGFSPLAVLPFLVGSEGNPVQTIIQPIPETENHRLQIESSRFLTNAFYINVLAQTNTDSNALQADQRDVGAWLQQHLQKITSQDFIEYNAKDYGTYSLESLLNLYEFDSINDPMHLVDASKIVMDLREAKFIAGSNLGRRLAPFRRHDYEDGYAPVPSDSGCSLSETSYLYHHSCSEDADVVWAATLVGQTQLIPTRDFVAAAYQPDPCVASAALNCWSGPEVEPNLMPSLIDIAASRYTMPVFLAELAVTRPGSITQRIKHDGLEYYYQGHSFSVSAGGVRTPAPYGGVAANLIAPHDRGDAMPTVIMPTLEGTTVDDVFSFDSVGTGGDRGANVCVWKGVICGVNAHQKLKPTLSVNYFTRYCTLDHDPGDSDVAYIDTSTCQIAGKRVPGPYFYLAEKIKPCAGTFYFCDSGQDYGVIEVVNASWNFGLTPPTPAPAGQHQFPSEYQAFKTSRGAALHALTFNPQGLASYVSSDGAALALMINRDRPHVVSVNGAPPPGLDSSGNVLATDGDIIVSDGQGNATIKSPATTQHIQINFDTPENPIWNTVP